MGTALGMQTMSYGSLTCSMTITDIYYIKYENEVETKAFAP
jgi:hypothetical protein